MMASVAPVWNWTRVAGGRVGSGVRVSVAGGRVGGIGVAGIGVAVGGGMGGGGFRGGGGGQGRGGLGLDGLKGGGHQAGDRVRIRDGRRCVDPATGCNQKDENDEDANSFGALGWGVHVHLS